MGEGIGDGRTALSFSFHACQHCKSWPASAGTLCPTSLQRAHGAQPPSTHGAQPPSIGAPHGTSTSSTGSLCLCGSGSNPGSGRTSRRSASFGGVSVAHSSHSQQQPNCQCPRIACHSSTLQSCSRRFSIKVHTNSTDRCFCHCAHQRRLRPRHRRTQRRSHRP